MYSNDRSESLLAAFDDLDPRVASILLHDGGDQDAIGICGGSDLSGRLRQAPSQIHRRLAQPPRQFFELMPVGTLHASACRPQATGNRVNGEKHFREELFRIGRARGLGGAILCEELDLLFVQDA
jgi:hypothetical protein